jgi:hypothetical protein
MNRIRLFSDAAEEVQVRAQLITRLPDLGEARKEYHKAFGYICALRDTSLFDSEQYGAAADLLNAAVSAAEAREKKAAPDGSNTGSGSKGGHPKEDDSLKHSFSLDEIAETVKGPKITVRDFAIALWEMIRAMKYGQLSDTQIVSILFSSLDPGKGEDSHAER